MNIGHIRKMTEGMPNETPLQLHMVSCPQDDLNVVIETIQPSQGRDRLDIHVSVVTDEELEEREIERITHAE